MFYPCFLSSRKNPANIENGKSNYAKLYGVLRANTCSMTASGATHSLVLGANSGMTVAADRSRKPVLRTAC